MIGWSGRIVLYGDMHMTMFVFEFVHCGARNVNCPSASLLLCLFLSDPSALGKCGGSKNKYCQIFQPPGSHNFSMEWRCPHASVPFF